MSALSEAIRRSFEISGTPGDASPMRVLGRRQLSGYEVLAQSIATTAPAVSMAVVPTMLLSQHRPATGLAILGSVLALTVLTAICLSQFTRRMVSPGGIYSFLFQGLGARGALAGGAAILLKYVASASITTYHGSTVAGDLLATAGIDPDLPVKPVVCVVIALVMLAILVRGAKVSAMVILCVETLSLVFIAGLMLTADPGAGTTAPGDSDGAMPFWLIAVFALAGFESATFLGSEAKRPYVTVTRAVLWTPVVCGILFVFAGWAAFTGRADAIVETYLYGGSAALNTATTSLLQLALCFSWLASAMASSNAASRIVFTMGIDRVLPRVVARVNPRFRTPAPGMAIAVGITSGVALTLIVSAGDTLLSHIQPLTRVGILLAYLLCGVAAWAFLHRIGELTGGVRACCAVVVAGSAVGLSALLVVDVNRHSGTVAAVLTAFAVGPFLWHRWLRSRHPHALAGVGAFDRADGFDVLPGAASYGPDPSGAVVLVAGSPRPRPSDGDDEPPDDRSPHG